MEREGKSGRPGYVLTKAFAEEWVHTVSPGFFCHTRMTQHFFEKQGEFDNFVRPFSDMDDTGRLLKAGWSNKGVTVKYNPAAKPGMSTGRDKKTYLNLYVPSKRVDYTSRRPSTPPQYSAYFRQVFPRPRTAMSAALRLRRPEREDNHARAPIFRFVSGKTTFTTSFARIWQTTCRHHQRSSISRRFSDLPERQFATVNPDLSGPQHRCVQSPQGGHHRQDPAGGEEVRQRVLRGQPRPHYRMQQFDEGSQALITLTGCQSCHRSPAAQPHQYLRSLLTALRLMTAIRKVKQWAKDYVKEHGHVQAWAMSPR